MVPGKLLLYSLKTWPSVFSVDAGLVEVDGGCAHGVRRHGDGVGVAKHLIEQHGVGQRLLEIGRAPEAAAEIGVLVDGEKDLLLQHGRETLLISLPLFGLGAHDVAG